MKNLIRLLLLTATASILTLNSLAQDAPPAAPAAPAAGGPGQGPGGRNIDPAQFQQQMQERMNAYIREKLSITNEDEWSVIQGRLSKVTQMRIDLAFAGLSGFRGMMGGNRNGGARRQFPMGQSSPEADALQQALDSDASKDQVKAALDNLRAVRERKKSELAKAQDDLKQLLTLRQEATLVSLGILD